MFGCCIVEIMQHSATRIQKKQEVSEPREFMAPKQASDYLGVSLNLLRKQIALGQGPPVHRIGRRRQIFFIDELREWVRSV